MRWAWLYLLPPLLGSELAIAPDHAFPEPAVKTDLSESNFPGEAPPPPPSPSSTLDYLKHIRTGQPEKVPVTDNFFTSFFTALGMILFSELGDKTFLIAAIMAMRHSRTKVFLATSAALTLMTVISVIAGQIVPRLVPRWVTSWVAAALLFVFGAMMVREGLEMGADHLKEEYDEVVHEIEGERGLAASLDALESQPTTPTASLAPATASERLGARITSIVGESASPIAIQTFSMVFLAEWGDRSQLATIVLAAAQNPWGVALGASAGHALCSLIAVWLGRALSSFLSIKTVTICGGFLFVLFGFLTLL